MFCLHLCSNVVYLKQINSEKDIRNMTIEQIEKVLPDIYRIPVPLSGNPLKELNSYVICGKGGRNLLVDTGFRTEECRQAVLDGLSLLGIRMEDTDILLTHLHTDHSGNAPDLICEGGKVYIGAIDQKLMSGMERMSVSNNSHVMKRNRFKKHGVQERILDEMFAKAPSRTMAGREGVIEYTPVQDGECLKAGQYTLRAIQTPGHTPGHMCFLIEDTGAMLLGDHVLFDITPNITDWFCTEDSLGDYLASLDIIDQYEVSIPLPGHRRRGDFHSRIAELKKHHEARLEECVEIVSHLSHAQLYEIAGHMKWKIRAADWDSFPAGQKWFALGECMAHLDHLVKTGRMKCHDDGSEVWYEV